MEEPKVCAVRTAAPRLFESLGMETVKWYVLTECGRTLSTEFPRGTRPTFVPCCGTAPQRVWRSKYGPSSKQLQSNDPEKPGTVDSEETKTDEKSEAGGSVE